MDFQYQTFHTRQNLFYTLTSPHFLSILITFLIISQKYITRQFSVLRFCLPPQFDQLQKQGNMVCRIQEIHMAILEKYKKHFSSILGSPFLLCSLLPLPSAATAVASSASCQQLLPKSHKSQPHMCPNTQIYTRTNTNTFQHTNTRLKIDRNTNKLQPTHIY